MAIYRCFCDNPKKQVGIVPSTSHINGAVPMLKQLTEAFIGRSESYSCRFCRLTFERERRNCPACGCDEIAPDR